MSDLQHCGICGEDYDRRSLDAVRFHMNDPHRPIEATGIMGEKIAERLPDGRTVYMEGYVEDLRRRESELRELVRRMNSEWSATEPDEDNSQRIADLRKRLGV